MNDSKKTAASLSQRDIDARLEKAAKRPQKGPKKALIESKKQKESYKRTMKRVQDKLPTTSRIFSKIIHSSFIEKLFEIIASTIARPNAILFGSVMAFITTLLIYVIAKNSGYTLSGFETIFAFIFGWIVGLIYDYIKAMITGNKL